MDLSPPHHELLDEDIVGRWWRSASPKDRAALRMYFGEAIFFERILSSHIADLPPGSTIVDIGSGIGLLSHLLSSRGVHVVMFEPEGEGFGRMRRLFELVSSAWAGPKTSLETRWEAFSPSSLHHRPVDLIFALNVIEHVPEPARMVAQATDLLKPSGTGRFVCPNYLFPYEPHYGIPTLWSKRATRLVFGKAIDSKALGLWDDLSWPTAGKLSRSLTAIGIKHELGREVFDAYLRRLKDPYFLERKGGLFQAVANAEPVVRRATDLIPTKALPIVDLTTRSGDS